ncbi:MAG: glycosyltransferase [Thermoleophilia bacterium]|nr:glycosyltransferase [Thermoleophilia bacterium]
MAASVVDLAAFAPEEELAQRRGRDLRLLRRFHRLAGPVLLYAGPYEPRGGLEHAIDAALRLSAEVPELRLVALPFGPIDRRYLDRCEREALRLGHHGIVEQRVEERDLPLWLAVADVVCCPATAAVNTLPVLLAQAARAPLVATAAALGQADPGDAVVRIPAGDPDALAAAVRGALDDAAAEPAGGRVGVAAIRLAYVASAPTNPYLRLLYSHLAERGVAAERWPAPSLRRLARSRGRVDLLHVHWPEGLYRARRGPRLLRPLLSRVKLVRLVVRLAAARALGYRIAWTVHQVLPHERDDRRLDLAAARLLARRADLLLAHDAATAHAVQERLGARRPVHVAPHGSYRGVYAERAGREATRRRLGIPSGAVAFLAFGELRAYKGVAALLDAFATLDGEEAALVVAGRPTDAALARRVREAQAADPRIVALLGVVPDEEVADLYAAADVAVVARADGGTSGSLVLALTLAKPVVVADRPAYVELARPEAAWLFDPQEPGSLERALRDAIAARHELPLRSARAAERAEALDWAPIADQLAELLRDAAER